MGMLIKKRVTFDFLGEEYAGAYIDLRSIPVLDFEKLQADIQALSDNQSAAFMIEALQRYFIGGQFPNADGVLEPVKAEDLADIDMQTAAHCFAIWTGQSIDPKASDPLTSPSTTEVSTSA